MKQSTSILVPVRDPEKQMGPIREKIYWWVILNACHKVSTFGGWISQIKTISYEVLWMNWGVLQLGEISCSVVWWHGKARECGSTGLSCVEILPTILVHLINPGEEGDSGDVMPYGWSTLWSLIEEYRLNNICSVLEDTLWSVMRNEGSSHHWILFGSQTSVPIVLKSIGETH